MVQKRPFTDEDSYEVSSKHPRQLEYSNQLFSFPDSIPAEDTAPQPNFSGDGDGNFPKDDEKFSCGNGLITTRIPDWMSNISWASSEEYDKSEAPFDSLSSPEYYNPDPPVRTPVRSKDIYTFLLERPPQKLVPVGPDFQADVPEWPAQGTKNTANLSDSPSDPEFDTCSPSENENKLAGTCVIPIPELGAFDDKVGDGRTDCCCEDSGSVRCVRQHIKESREKLCRILGLERFSELGFFDMGEVVADQWSLVEEREFHKVLVSNPASSGKNFWDHLSMALPSRTKREIASYYFNVFMLRRRAKQNRCDPVNIDSDDDEWHDDGFGLVEENEDSVGECPVGRYDSGHTEIEEDELGFIMEPCNNEEWDFGYLTFPKTDEEFLPTCSMIEVVFGVGAWNH